MFSTWRGKGTGRTVELLKVCPEFVDKDHISIRGYQWLHFFFTVNILYGQTF